MPYPLLNVDRCPDCANCYLAWGPYPFPFLSRGAGEWTIELRCLCVIRLVNIRSHSCVSAQLPPVPVIKGGGWVGGLLNFVACVWSDWWTSDLIPVSRHSCPLYQWSRVGGGLVDYRTSLLVWDQTGEHPISFLCLGTAAHCTSDQGWGVGWCTTELRCLCVIGLVNFRSHSCVSAQLPPVPVIKGGGWVGGLSKIKGGGWVGGHSCVSAQLPPVPVVACVRSDWWASDLIPVSRHSCPLYQWSRVGGGLVDYQAASLLVWDQTGEHPISFLCLGTAAPCTSDQGWGVGWWTIELRCLCEIRLVNIQSHSCVSAQLPPVPVIKGGGGLVDYELRCLCVIRLVNFRSHSCVSAQLPPVPVIKGGGWVGGLSNFVACVRSDWWTSDLIPVSRHSCPLYQWSRVGGGLVDYLNFVACVRSDWWTSDLIPVSRHSCPLYQWSRVGGGLVDYRTSLLVWDQTGEHPISFLCLGTAAPCTSDQGWGVGWWTIKLRCLCEIRLVNIRSHSCVSAQLPPVPVIKGGGGLVDYRTSLLVWDQTGELPISFLCLSTAAPCTSDQGWGVGWWTLELRCLCEIRLVKHRSHTCVSAQLPPVHVIKGGGWVGGLSNFVACVRSDWWTSDLIPVSQHSYPLYQWSRVGGGLVDSRTLLLVCDQTGELQISYLCLGTAAPCTSDQGWGVGWWTIELRCLCEIRLVNFWSHSFVSAQLPPVPVIKGGGWVGGLSNFVAWVWSDWWTSDLFLVSRHSCPPVPVIKELLNSVQRVTFYGFLMALSKDAAVNGSIGEKPSILIYYIVHTIHVTTPADNQEGNSMKCWLWWVRCQSFHCDILGHFTHSSFWVEEGVGGGGGGGGRGWVGMRWVDLTCSVNLLIMLCSDMKTHNYSKAHRSLWACTVCKLLVFRIKLGVQTVNSTPAGGVSWSWIVFWWLWGKEWVPLKLENLILPSGTLPETSALM